ncbi:MAG: NCS2 family permease [Bdellovibrionales bacterium]|nr:NCS2 family permease [Bdellovibrionales bacterium]
MNSDLRKDLVGGVTTFLTMAYIVVVNPSILSTAGTGMSFSGVLTATVLVAFSMTLLMGLYAKLPFGVAPGMGINAFFTFSLVLGHQIPWPTALGMIFWAGVLFVVTSVTPVRVAIARAIPHSLRVAAATGIGLFLTFIGLKNAGFVVADPATFVKLGHFTPGVWLAIVGFGVIVFLLKRKSPFAFLAGIAVATLGGWALGLVKAPEEWVAKPDFSSTFFKLDILGALKFAYLPAILAIFFTDLFDSLSTFIGVSQATGLVDEKGDPVRLKEGLLVDAFATLGAGLFGTSSGTAFIESAAGIEAGGRSGRAAVVTALCFLPCFFIGPLVGVVPAFATAPVLVVVGALMFQGVSSLKIAALEDAIPVFLTIILIPLTFSITQGILWGFISHVALYAAFGRAKEVPPTMWAIGAVSAGLVALEQYSGF